MNDLELLSDGIRSVAKSAGSHIVSAQLDTTQAACPTVFLSVAELLSFVAAIRPTIVYVFETTLDAEAEIASALEEIGAERGERAFADVTRSGRRLSTHEGQPARISVEIVVNGVLHVAYAEASWIEEFGDEVRAVAARASEEGAAHLREAKKTASARVRALAERLMADPAFDSGRSSFAKRRFLAGEIFPDEDERTLDDATETAENMRWLAAGRG